MADARAFPWMAGWKSVIDDISEGIVVFDATQQLFPIVFVNRAFELLSGYRADEAHGRSFTFLQGTDIDQADYEKLHSALGEGRHAQALVRNYRKDGSLFWNDIAIFPLRDATGQVTHFVSVQNSATERVEMENRLAEVSADLELSRAQLQATFDSITEGIVVLDSSLNVVRVNRTAALLFDIEDASLTSQQTKAIFEVFLPDGTLLAPEAWPTALAVRGEYVHEVEYSIRRKDTGRTVIVLASAAPVIRRNDSVEQVLVTYRDITESRILGQARDLLAAIVESSQDAIIGKDMRGIVTSWNRGAQKVFGYSSAQMIGESIRRLLPERIADQEDDILTRIRHGETVEHFETERLTQSGRTIHVSLTISPIRDSSGNIIGASKIARDITEQRNLEHQLRQSQKMEAIGQLTGGIAHDFNNLLGVIVGNLDLLERLVAGNEAALKRISTAQKGASRGASLTRRLLAFSSNESLEPRSIALSEPVNNTLELAGRAIGPHIRITTQMDPSLPDVFIDGASLESALLNLVVNARDAMPRGGQISISTELRRLEASYPPVLAGELPAGAYARVSISDSGHGMPKDVLDRAFEPFFTTKPRSKGTGLGLAMVYGFAKQSGGTVRIYSEVDYGTTVSLYLPLTNGPVVTEEQAVSEAHQRIVGRSVLLVDDETDLLEIAAAYLHDLGAIPYQASDGASALEVLSQHPEISLMVTDVIMPGGMNGVELAQKVRKSHPAVRVIYCSGFPAASLAERTMPLIDGPLLHKPYQRADFERAVTEGKR